jgi:hypothetical protein
MISGRCEYCGMCIVGDVVDEVGFFGLEEDCLGHD